MPRFKILALILGVLALLVFVAGCGDSDSDSGSTGGDGSTEASTKEPSGEPILIGELTPLSGEGFNFPTWLAGAEAAARAINAKGGVQGRPIEIVECDDKNNPNEAVKCARDLVSEGVVAVAGGASLFGSAIAPILNENDVAWVGNYPGSEPEFNLPNMMLLDKGPIDSGASSAGTIARAGAKSVFIAELALPQSKILVDFFKKAAPASGLEIVGETSFPITAADMTPTVQEAKNSGAESVMIFSIPQQQVAIMKTGEQLGLDAIYAANDGTNTPNDYRTSGAKRAVVGGGTPPVTAYESNPDEFPGLASFKPDMEAEFEAGNEFADPEEAGYYTMHAWLAVKVIAELAEELDQIDAKSVLDAFNSAKDIETGVIPPWTPSADNGPPGYSRVSNPFSWASEINAEGQPELIESEPFNGVELVEK